MFDIAIVGLGANGVSLLMSIRNQVLAAGLETPRIVVFSPAGTLGRGEAFGAAHRHHLVNTSPPMMPLSEAAPNAFARWLASVGRGAETYPPRQAFADYLESEFQTLLKGGIVQIVPIEAAVEAIAKVSGGVELHTATHKFAAKRAVLCLGAPRGSSFPEFSADPAFSLAYAATADDRDSARHLPGDEEPILVAGTGLTAVDVFRSLNIGQSREIHLFSRHGLPPTCLTSQSNHVPRHFSFDALAHRPTGRLALHDFLSALKEDCRELPDGGEHVAGARLLREEGLSAFFRFLLSRADAGDLPYQDLLVSTRPYMHDLWRMLSIEDRLAFLLNHGAHWAAWRHPVPRQVVKEMQTAAAEGRLHIHRAATRPTRSGRHFEITTSAGLTVRSGTLIDATGGSIRLGAMDSPLLAQMQAAGLVQPHPCGGIDVHPLTFECRVNGSQDSRLSCLGPLTKGTFFSTNAFGFNARCAAQWARLWAIAQTRPMSALV